MELANSKPVPMSRPAKHKIPADIELPSESKRLRAHNLRSELDSVVTLSLYNLPSLAWNCILPCLGPTDLVCLSLTSRDANAVIKCWVKQLRIESAGVFRDTILRGMTRSFQVTVDRLIQNYGISLRKLTLILACSENRRLRARDLATTVSKNCANLVHLEAKFEYRSLTDALFGSPYEKPGEFVRFSVEQLFMMPKVDVLRASLWIYRFGDILDALDRLGQMEEVAYLDLTSLGDPPRHLVTLGIEPLHCVKNVSGWEVTQSYVELFPSATVLFGKCDTRELELIPYLTTQPEKLTKLSINCATFRLYESLDMLATFCMITEFNVGSLYHFLSDVGFSNFNFLSAYERLECLRLGNYVVGKKGGELMGKLSLIAPLKHLCLDDNTLRGGSYTKLLLELIPRGYPLQDVYLRGKCSIPSLTKLFTKFANSLESLRVNLVGKNSSSIFEKIPNLLLARLRNLCLHGTWEMPKNTIDAFLARRRLLFQNAGTSCSVMNLWVPFENWPDDQVAALKEEAWSAGVKIL